MQVEMKLAEMRVEQFGEMLSSDAPAPGPLSRIPSSFLNTASKKSPLRAGSPTRILG